MISPQNTGYRPRTSVFKTTHYAPYTTHLCVNLWLHFFNSKFKIQNSKLSYPALCIAVLIFALIPFLNAVTTAETNVFLVRTRSYLQPGDYQQILKKLEEDGYHPFVREEKTKDGNFFYLELGSFTEPKTALPLVMELRSRGYPFFLYATSAETKTDGQILSPITADNLFPSRGGNVDRLELIMEIAGAKSPPAPLPGVITTKKPAHITPPAVTGAGAKPIVQPKSSPIRDRLRDIAWEMREKGFRVYVENESTTTSEGTLVGIFDNKEDAADLGNELSSYGYNVQIMKEAGNGERYFVYVAIGEPSSQPSASEEKKPEPSPASPLDYLLDNLRKQ